MKRIFLMAIFTFTLITAKYAFTIDCPTGYFSANIEVRDTNGAMMGWMFICYKCEDTEVGEVIFKGGRQVNEDLFTREEFETRAMEVFQDPKLLYELCDIPPCKGDYHYYQLDVPACLYYKWDLWPGDTAYDHYLAPCGSHFCWKVYKVCFNDTIYEVVVDDSGSTFEGEPKPCTLISDSVVVPDTTDSDCFINPAAWCFD